MATLRNFSSHLIWIAGDEQKHRLEPGQTNTDIGLEDADGLLLDGRPVLFDSRRTELGGGQIHTEGAIKVCDFGTLTIEDADIPDALLIARISMVGFLCPGETAGYKSPGWCCRFPGWEYATAPVARRQLSFVHPVRS